MTPFFFSIAPSDIPKLEPLWQFYTRRQILFIRLILILLYLKKISYEVCCYLSLTLCFVLFFQKNGKEEIHIKSVNIETKKKIPKSYVLLMKTTAQFLEVSFHYSYSIIRTSFFSWRRHDFFFIFIFYKTHSKYCVAGFPS